MRVELLTIGDELLDGVIADTNSAWLCEAIGQIGGQVQRVQSVRDNLDVLVDLLRDISARADVCICTGGLGPTPDDLTVDALAVAGGSRLQHDDAVWNDIVTMFSGRTPSENNRRQARIPEGAEALRSTVGTAPGIRIRIGTCTVFALPGVSREMKWHYETYISPFLHTLVECPTVTRTLKFAGIGESTLAERIGELVCPPGTDVLYRTHLPENHVRLRATDESTLNAFAEMVIGVAPEAYLGDQALSLPAATLASCRRHGLTLGTAESCTGGLLGAHLTEVSGASDVYVGTVVSYSNSVKETLLGVEPQIIASHGAVSEETARAMASGAQIALGCDIAVSITGIAGPTGGTADKPVGTVWIAWAGPGLDDAKLRIFRGNRQRIRRLAMGYALDRIRRHYGPV